MKKVFLSLALATAVTSGLNAQTVLSGNITVNTTLSDGCYLLDGCVYVKAPAVLTINPGTVILGSTTVGAEGALIIERGAKINADGQPNPLIAPNPIIFTSANAAGSRASGDWGGIIIAGKGKNNAPGDTFIVEGPCTPVVAGGTDSLDNSGVFRFVQVHYAGVDASSVPGGGNEINSVTLAAVGRGTTIDHVQVTYANDDAFEWFGGSVNTSYLISYNTKDDDFDTDFGFNGKSQFGFALRQDLAQNDISGSNGIESDNNNVTPGFPGAPKTSPVFSNYSLFGPLYCNATAPSNFRSGAHIRRNSAHSLYNTVITGWPVNGLLIDGATTMANTVSDAFQFSYNTLANNTTDYNWVGTWSGCGTSMTNWITGAGSPTCSETGNQFISALGYSSTICDNGCESTPGFTLGTTIMDGPDFTSPELSDSYFDPTANFRGAFGSNDWTIGWTNWCPQSTEYCGEGSRATGSENTLQLVPNPSSSTTYAVFNASVTGSVRISVLDKVSGQALRTVDAQVVTAGAQRIAFNVAGLQAGVYTVKVETAAGTFAQQLMVK
jgi:hypothetical protein